jgi:hypothetical protein
MSKIGQTAWFHFGACAKLWLILPIYLQVRCRGATTEHVYILRGLQPNKEEVVLNFSSHENAQIEHSTLAS